MLYTCSMASLTARDFVLRWSRLQGKLNEVSTAQSHFKDICDLVGHPHPYDGMIDEQQYRFEKSADKPSGNKGRADVFLHDKFVWEYKAHHGDLGKAYQQAQMYAIALGNPPLIITSTTQEIHIYACFTGYPTEKTVLKLEALNTDEGLATLQAVFGSSEQIIERFRPTRTKELITHATAKVFVDVVDQLKAFDTDETPPEQYAQFMGRLIFCLFAEDMGLLPNNLFKRVVSDEYPDETIFPLALQSLFMTMRDGGLYGNSKIPFFNGDLFNNDFVPPFSSNMIRSLLRATRQSWRDVEPSIFGTLFERVINPAKRSQLGAHYTNQDDILLVVEPVLMRPLRREWDEVRRKAERLIDRGENDNAHTVLLQFSAKIADTTVLDPACGSGNFLYVALRQLLDLQQEVSAAASRLQLPDIPITVSPRQLHGIEINPFARELSQITIWIGYIQWRNAHNYNLLTEPILQSLNQIQYKDAIVGRDKDGNLSDPPWPETKVIMGNPPFLGDKKLQSELTETYTRDLYRLFKDKIPAQSDLVCYWFERARAQLEAGRVERVGLIATQSIRGGANRTVIDRIKQTGDLFLGISDRNWFQEDVNVHISIIGFDDGSETRRTLDGHVVPQIYADLTADVDITSALPLSENEDLAFQGITKRGVFDIPSSLATQFIDADPKNGDVLFPFYNSRSITTHWDKTYIIDFNGRSEEKAAEYALPFAHVLKHNKTIPEKEGKIVREDWWQHWRSRPAMRTAIKDLPRFIVTPRVSAHRVFVWKAPPVIPSDATIVFARSDNYFFGVLHSIVHELWSTRKGTQLREMESGRRYTPLTTFRTFPLPWRPGTEPDERDEDVFEIADAARRLVKFRQAWLHPNLDDPEQQIAPSALKKRTLTHLYNGLRVYRDGRASNTIMTPPFKKAWRKAVKCDLTIPQAERLHDIHTDLDHAVLRAYGWPTDATNEQILERLLALNLERAAA